MGVTSLIVAAAFLGWPSYKIIIGLQTEAALDFQFRDGPAEDFAQTKTSPQMTLITLIYTDQKVQ